MRRRPEFEASLAEARRAPELWRLGLGTLLALLLWLGTGALIVALGVAVVAAREGPLGVMPWLTGLAAPDSPGAVLVLLLTFAGLFIGALTAAAALHSRGPGTLFGPAGDWARGFLIALAVVLPVYGAATALQFALDAPEPNLPLARWAALLPLALPLLLLQVAAEEVFFRGYLQQQLAARFRARLVWMGLPAIVFAALHGTPNAGANLPLVLLATFTFALIAADLTERTGSLGAAMGLHFGNNAFGLLIVGTEGSITGLARHVAPGDPGQIGAQTVGIVLAIFVLLAVWGIIVRLLDR